MPKSHKDELFHYGIKGMKWGRSKASSKSSSKSESSEKGSDDHETAQKLRKKSPKSMSNAELKTLNERMQLEQNYSNLMNSTRGKSKVEKGRAKVDTVLGIVGTANKIYNTYNSPAVRQIRDIIGK